MSTWGIGDNHDSDEIRTLKDQLRTKDAAYATLHGEYLKKELELNEIKASRDDTLDKLRREADRVTQLDVDLKRRNEELANERNTRQNAETALTTTQRKLKDSEKVAQELQSTIESLSTHANSTSAGHSKLEQDNAALQTRVRALERELQSKTHAEELVLLQSQSASARQRRRSSSESSFRVSALEQEVADLRANSVQQAEELQKASDQLTRSRDAFVQLQNEKTAMEKRLHKELEQVQAALADREDDLRILRDSRGGEDMAAREAELLERLEEEEKRVAVLENELARSSGSRKRDLAMLQDELDRATMLLEDANNKAGETEARLAVLLREKEAALDERNQMEQEYARLVERLNVADGWASNLEKSNAESSLPSPSPKTPDEATVAMMEKLLNTIERLRGERDGLRRDLEFLNAENRFAVQSLEAKLVAATSAPATPTANPAEVNALRGHMQTYQEQAQRSARAAVALAVVVQHSDEHASDIFGRIQGLVQELAHTHERLFKTQSQLQECERAAQDMRQQLSSATQALNIAESHESGLRSTIERLENELSHERDAHTEKSAALADLEGRLAAANLALTNAEAGRDALALAKTHLEQDLETARQELADADDRHAQQLNAFSSGKSNAGEAALRAHIKELEARIDRRTAQIGMHQHDIARLEMNLKLQEERLAEMTAEMDVAQSEKDAMLEDCRTTRDQRDEALRRCDELEEALDAVEQARGSEVETMVHVAFSSIAQRRDVLVRSMLEGRTRREEVARLKQRVSIMESERDALSAQISVLLDERDRLARTLDDSTRAYEDLSQEHGRCADEREQTSAQTKSLEVQLEQVSVAVRAAEDAKAAAESQLVSLRSELESKADELTTMQAQLASLHHSNSNRQSLEASLFAQEKAELETQLQGSRASLADVEGRHQETVAELKRVEEELKRAEDELSRHLSDSAIRSESEERLRTELARTKHQYEEEIASLQDQLKVLSHELAETSRCRKDADASRQAAEEELQRTKQQLESHLAEVGDSLNAASRLQAELEDLKAAHENEIKALQARLDAISIDLEDAIRRRDELQASYEEAVLESAERAGQLSDAQEKASSLETELTAIREAHAAELRDLDERLAKTTSELNAIKDSQSDTEAQQCQKVDDLSRTVEELQGRVIALTREADKYRADLDEEKVAHAQTKDLSSSELHSATSKLEEAQAALAEIQRELSAVRAELEHATSSLVRVEKEKLDLQYQATNLEAEVQRLKSLQRLSISDIQYNSERHVSTLEAELQDLRNKCTALDKLAKSTEANLAMQTIQHEQTVASLKRELNTLRAQPRLEDEIADLREKNAEMEELLRAKCLEIEENDDRFIEMLKEKKKLTNKIDSLTRKVQNLQVKLTAASEQAAATPVATAVPSASVSGPPLRQAPVFTPSPVLAPAPVLSGSLASSSSSRPTSRPRVVTAPASHSPASSHNQAPPMPTFRPKTPESRLRMASGPSSISRAKTPESRIPPMPVFKARTPERYRTSTAPAQVQMQSQMPESMSSSSVVGVKRRAPDDFDDCDSLPPQPFTADSAPGLPLPAQPTTPRLRKALQSMRSGFTPVRNHLSRAGSSSPTRRATTGSSAGAQVPPTISDVTNSPRTSSHPENPKAAAAKKGWLGKLKSGPSQQPRPPLASRPPSYDPPGMR
ncbi:hypothetical protein BN946_scf185007.g76 [Trametes cinnabarina]|uniref:Uncharacterized protein n=1 Tax=Pycnoporus cinnabarinus TaxID=5643 RepID=A0A060SES6_PYCCI|nr:hypothetical protein BN946_scf185007.g76 [Trametes cinnabarina]